MSFTRQDGRLMRGPQNRNIREERGRDGQVVIEVQTRSLWGTTYGKWDRETARINHKRAREYADEKR